jgi:hypothetical protein
MATARLAHRHEVGPPPSAHPADSARIARLVGVNESLAIAGHALGRKRRRVFLCECGSVGCRGLVRLALSEYERIRRRRALLLLVGHELQA